MNFKVLLFSALVIIEIAESFLWKLKLDIDGDTSFFEKFNKL